MHEEVLTITVNRGPEFLGSQFIDGTLHISDIVDLTIIKLALQEHLERSQTYVKAATEAGDKLIPSVVDEIARIKALLEQLNK